MRCIAVINQKGGVGKTTTTVNLGAALARRGHRVLLLDMDPQANLTVHVDKRPDLEGNTLTNLMVEDRPLHDLVQATGTENLFVVPSDTSLAGVEQVLANRIGRETILREALETFARRDEFDFLLLDCPPSLGVLSANALVAAEQVVIPMQAQYLSLQGMAKLIEVIMLVQKRLNPSLHVALVLPCMVDSRTNLSAEVLREIEQHFGGQLARTRIRNNVKLAEAPSFGRTIFEHAPDSNGARDYEAVAQELLERLGLAEPVIEEDEEAVDDGAEVHEAAAGETAGDADSEAGSQAGSQADSRVGAEETGAPQRSLGAEG
ncbi:MAG: ParA family protein [Planctomycetota bacterium]